jgi:hypothetical protein
VTTFAQPFELIFRYGETDTPDALTFMVLNEETGQWEPVPTRVDTSTRRVIAVLDHFGEFALVRGESDVPALYLPLITR